MSSASHSDHDHDHDHATGARLRWALVLTSVFMVLEVAAGFWSGSLALLADAGHMLTDSAALGLALFAVVVSRRPPDARRTYGYGRMRVLAAFINGLALLVIAAWIVIEAVRRLDRPVEILAGPMLVVALAGFVVNVIVYLILRGGTDLNTRGAMAHVLGDLLGSVAAIAAATIILATGWTRADPLLSIVVAALIVRTGWHVTRESGHALLEGSPPDFDAGKVERSLLEAIPELQGVHHVHAWTVGADDSYVTLHVCAADSLGPDSAVARVQMHLAERFGYQHITVQVEYGDCADQAH
jgi:cobalt-zinc-cadmium efflux system protein